MVEREIADAIDVLGGEVRSRDQQCAALRYEGFLDVALRNRHVGAILAKEDERESILVLDPQHDGAGKPGRIDADVADVAPFARDRLDQESSEPVVADARDQRRLEAQARASERGVGRRTAEILGEARHILQPRTDLLGVEVDRKAAEADHVQRSICCEAGAVLH